MQTLESFTAYTNGEVRPEKCEVTGMDFKTNQPLDVSGVYYKNAPLPWVHPKKAIKEAVPLPGLKILQVVSEVCAKAQKAVNTNSHTHNNEALYCC